MKKRIFPTPPEGWIIKGDEYRHEASRLRLRPGLWCDEKDGKAIYLIIHQVHHDQVKVDDFFEIHTGLYIHSKFIEAVGFPPAAFTRALELSKETAAKALPQLQAIANPEEANA